jgi:hypothetical protein
MRVVLSALAVPFAVLAFHSSIEPLPPALRAQMKGKTWHAGCPVPLSQLRVLTVPYWGFDRHKHMGRLIVNRDVAVPLVRVFRRLYELRFPIGSLTLDIYDPRKAYNPDASGSFECRPVAANPCPGVRRSTSWSQHAYGRAVDINPVENPYVGLSCGQTREPKSKPYLDRSRLQRGMVTPAVVAAFKSIGWGWGGDWSTTKDYMHFSVNGH